MNLSKLIRLFWSTLWIGAGAGLFIGVIIALFDGGFTDLTGLEVGYNLLMMLMAGMMFGVLSQMFFFAYMTLNYIAGDMFRRPTTWVLIQLFFIITVPFEIYFFMWEGSLWSFVLGAGLILAISVGAAYWKTRMTANRAFIPTLFFMFVFTVLETAIALKVSNNESIWRAVLLMAIPLLLCNAWQILRLHKLVEKKES